MNGVLSAVVLVAPMAILIVAFAVLRMRATRTAPQPPAQSAVEPEA